MAYSLTRFSPRMTRGGVARAAAIDIAACSTLLPHPLRPRSRHRGGDARGPPRRRRPCLLRRRRRRDAVHRRRVRLRQIDDRAVDHAAPAGTDGADRRRRGAARRARAHRPARARDAAAARRRHRHDLPGADDLAQSGPVHRPPAHRGDPHASPSRPRRGEGGGGRGAEGGAHRPTPSSASANIRTSSRAGCASAS